MNSNWTPVALSQDVPASTASPGRVGDRELVIWRSASGKVAAWDDRCPHRGMRLSHGFVRGEFLSCIYHGWRYGADGQCRKIPAHPELTPPDAIRVPGCRVAERSGVIWVSEAETDAEAGEVPEFPGFSGFRSLRVAADADRLAAALGGRGRIAIGDCQVVALIQPLATGECGLHLLAPEGADADRLDALSVAVEALRRQAEQERSAA